MRKPKSLSTQTLAPCGARVLPKHPTLRTASTEARRSALSLILAGTVTFAGCSSVLLAPSVDVSDVPLPVTWSSGTAASPATSISDWWRRFDDDELTIAVAMALQANPDVRTAKAALVQSRAQRDVIAAALYPSLFLNGSAKRGKIGQQNPANAYVAGFDAGWEPDVFGGTAAGVAAADANVNAAVASLGDVQVSIAAEVASNYIDLRAQELRLAIARENLASQTETLQIAMWRTEAGLTTSLDVEQARTSAELTRAEIPQLETSIAQARNALAVLLGITPETLEVYLRPGSGIPKAPDELAVAFPADTLRQRPDVVQAEYLLRAAAAQVSQADAARYPSFGIDGTLGLSALAWGSLTSGSSLIASIIGSFAQPIFDGGARAAQVRVQLAQYEKARVAYEKTVLSALQEVEDALIELRNARERLQTLRRASEAAGNAALLARHRYESGVIDFQPVLQTQATLLSVQDKAANAQATLGLAHVHLYKALGGGWLPGAPAAEERDRERAPLVGTKSSGKPPT